MRLALVAPPAEEPVSLAEAKLHLRVGQDGEDATISAMIGAARELCELHTARSFVTTTWDLMLDDWPCWGSGPIQRFPIADVIAVESVTYDGTDGTGLTLDASGYAVATGAGAGVRPARGYSWPSSYAGHANIAIRFTAGYGAAADVPLAVKQAILLTVAHLYENRGEESAELPPTVRLLLATAVWGGHF